MPSLQRVKHKIPTESLRDITLKYKILRSEPKRGSLEVLHLVNEVRAINSAISPLEAKKQEYKECIAAYMQDFERLTDDLGTTVVEWKIDKDVHVFDLLSFKKDYPELFSAYTVITKGRRVMRFK